MTRKPLPNRRPNLTVHAIWGDETPLHFAVTIGFDAEGRPKEAFAAEAKGAMLAIIADACILISIGLQHGLTPHDLSKSLGRVTEWATVDGERRKVDAPASPIGTILGVVMDALPNLTDDGMMAGKGK